MRIYNIYTAQKNRAEIVSLTMKEYSVLNLGNVEVLFFYTIHIVLYLHSLTKC